MKIDFGGVMEEVITRKEKAAKSSKTKAES